MASDRSESPAHPPGGPTPPSPAAPSPPDRAKRQRLFGMLLAGLIFTGMGGAYGLYWWLVGRFHVGTEDAYVAGNRIQVTSQVAGTIIAVHADDTHRVQAGDILVVLDDTDARVALDQAGAVLAQRVREVRELFAQTRVLEATVEVREAESKRAEDDLTSQNYLARTGAGSQEARRHADNDVAQTRARLASAREDLAAAQVLIDRTSVQGHPNVRLAAAQLRAAYLDWRRTRVPAPVSGQVAQRSAQVGQRTEPGTPLMSIVSLDELWVDANFKEAQLPDARIGQPVDMTADFYGGDVHYHGRVMGLSAGTGSAFALLPAQNATGNWIKVVQRVPVRIALDPRELATHPLRIGLSMRTILDVRDRTGSQLAVVQPETPVAETSVYAALDRDAQALIDQVIAENLAAPDTSATPAETASSPLDGPAARR